jgi:hypothetical protein
VGQVVHLRVEDNMIALGDLSPIDSVRGQLQAQIGSFLQGRARLDRLMKVQNLQVQGQAQGLYAVQAALEDRFQNEITPKLQKISTGTWDTSDVLTLGGFTGLVVKQLNDVGSLEKAAGISGPLGSGLDIDITTIILGGVIVLGLGLMGGGYLSGRSQSGS